MIYIAYPDIPAQAVARTASGMTLNADYPNGNLVYGERYLRALETGTATGTKIVTYDMGRDLAGTDITSTSSFLVLARADILKAQGVTTTELHGAAVSDFSTKITPLTFDLSAATLYGPNSNDYYNVFAASAAKRYWRVAFTSPSATFQLSKIYFGTPFDFGIGPSKVGFTRGPKYASTLETSSGAVEMGRLEELIYTFTFTWQNVSDDITKSFLEKIVRFSNKWRYFLYTNSTATHFLLDNKRIVHVKLKSHSTENVCQNKNIITASFEEIIG